MSAYFVKSQNMQTFIYLFPTLILTKNHECCFTAKYLNNLIIYVSVFEIREVITVAEGFLSMAF